MPNAFDIASLGLIVRKPADIDIDSDSRTENYALGEDLSIPFTYDTGYGPEAFDDVFLTKIYDTQAARNAAISVIQNHNNAQDHDTTSTHKLADDALDTDLASGSNIPNLVATPESPFVGRRGKQRGSLIGAMPSTGHTEDKDWHLLVAIRQGPLVEI